MNIPGYNEHLIDHPFVGEVDLWHLVNGLAAFCNERFLCDSINLVKWSEREKRLERIDLTCCGAVVALCRGR